MTSMYGARALAAARPRHADGAELLGQPAHADAEIEPAAR
jgi:hypothetical protein